MNAFPTVSNRQDQSFISKPATSYSGTSTSLLQANSNPSLIRGDNYGESNNSTIPSAEEVAEAVGVRPPIEAPKSKWKRAWDIHKRAIPLLHISERLKLFRNPRHGRKKLQMVDSKLNLACLWWKALAGNDPTSPTFDNGLSFDLLPKGTRHVVNPFCVKLGIYPRLHHATVEIRTAFLDRAVVELIQFYKNNINSTNDGDNTDDAHERSSRTTKFRLISMGAGYDVRSIKLLTNGIINEAYELDLPEVVEAKQELLGSKRFRNRRKHLKEEHLPKLIGVDLNQLSDFREALRSIVVQKDHESGSWHNIFLFEGVMIYLNEGIPTQLLSICGSVIREFSSSSSQQINLDTSIHGASLCLADRMENVPGGDKDLGMKELNRTGWELKTWLPKPGLARHMCTATLI